MKSNVLNVSSSSGEYSDAILVSDVIVEFSMFVVSGTVVESYVVVIFNEVIDTDVVAALDRAVVSDEVAATAVVAVVESDFVVICDVNIVGDALVSLAANKI